MRFEVELRHAARHDSEQALCFAMSLFMELVDCKKWDEARQMQREISPRLRRVLGTEDSRVLASRSAGARILYEHPDASLEEARKAVTSLEKIARTTERVLSENDGSIQTIMYTPLLNYVRNDLLKKARAKVARLSGADEQDEVEDAD